MPACDESPWALQFPRAKLGSGGGNDEGSKAGSSVCGCEVDIPSGVEVCFRDRCSMVVSFALDSLEFVVLGLVPLALLFSKGAAPRGS